jgi:hypothetical protein
MSPMDEDRQREVADGRESVYLFNQGVHLGPQLSAGRLVQPKRRSRSTLPGPPSVSPRDSCETSTLDLLTACMPLTSQALAPQHASTRSLASVLLSPQSAMKGHGAGCSDVRLGCWRIAGRVLWCHSCTTSGLEAERSFLDVALLAKPPLTFLRVSYADLPEEHGRTPSTGGCKPSIPHGLRSLAQPV